MAFKRDQGGFSAFEMIVALAVVAIVGGIGWYVWHTASSKDKAESPSNTVKLGNGLLRYENRQLNFSFEYPEAWGDANFESTSFGLSVGRFSLTFNNFFPGNTAGTHNPKLQVTGENYIPKSARKDAPEWLFAGWTKDGDNYIGVDAENDSKDIIAGAREVNKGLYFSYVGLNNGDDAYKVFRAGVFKLNDKQPVVIVQYAEDFSATTQTVNEADFLKVLQSFKL